MTQPRRIRAAALVMAALGAVATGAAPSVASAPGAAPAGCTGPASGTWLNVVVDGVRNGSGVIAITLYADDSKKFLVKRGSLYVGRVEATAGTTRGCIFLPKPGVYAVALYHDENRDMRFDRSGLGLPAEGFGFSNNPSIFFSAPSFKRVRFAVSGPGVAIRIKMKYP